MSPFYNPYAFVPAPARSGERDGPPAPLGILDERCWTGRLRLEITATQPLLITEQDEGEERTRRTLTVRGEVALPGTSLKGMIRSEFEMVTNSRFGVFDEHGKRLGHRIGAAQPQSADLVPVMVVDAAGAKRAVLLPGRASGMQAAGRDALAAAWVPRYRGRIVAENGVGHGDRVHAWVILMRRDGFKNDVWSPRFLYWRVVSMSVDRSPMPEVKPTDHATQSRFKRHVVVDATPVEISGFYFRTGQNTENKYNERIFFAPGLLEGPRLTSVELRAEVVTDWATLLDSYADAASIAGPGDAVAGLEQSRHRDRAEMERLRPLPHSTFAYAEMEGTTVVGLYPVALSRRLYDVAPGVLAAQAGLVPAREHAELSPADRLFGWVSPRRGRSGPPGTRALRGRVRLGAVVTERAEVVPVGKGLAILAQPRPTQDLFYAARDGAGRPLRTSPGYQKGQGLRGRKVYPHQPGTRFGAGAPTPWLLHGTGEEVTTQNARLVDMVAPGARFHVDLHVENVTNDELGDLLWVLRGRDAAAWRLRQHKLGGGKPLGFGSVTVQLKLAESDVRETGAWRSYFALEDGGRTLDERIVQDRVDRAARRAPGTVGDAYEAYLAGFVAGTPVHYPADPRNLGSDEKRYAWFVDNRAGDRRALGELGKLDLALPDKPNGDRR